MDNYYGDYAEEHFNKELTGEEITDLYRNSDNLDDFVSKMGERGADPNDSVVMYEELNFKYSNQ